MSWEQLEGIRKTQETEVRDGDEITGGRKPISCPICLSRLNYSGSVGDCPLGHYRTEG